jgi:hypothetical protein
MSSLGRDGDSDLKSGMAPASQTAKAAPAANVAALICALATLWLATRSYPGLGFDARFYMVEALHALDPRPFAQDLYFQFGSQGNFSLFTKLYLPLLRLFGVGATAVILTVAGQALWLFGLVRLTRSLLGRQSLWLSLALTIGMLHSYPGGFGYGENQLTARLFAEAVTMLGLSLLAARPLAAAGLLVLAAALHPLMALPGIAVALVNLALARPVWWAAMGAGAGIAAALGLAGVAPFSNLFRTIDPEWFAIVNTRSMYCFLGNWPMEFFIQAAAILAWGLGALVLAGPEHRRLLTAAFVVGVGGLVCSFFGADLAHNLLLAQIQPWRSLWLLQLVSHIYMPLVIAGLLRRTSFESSRWTVILGMALIVTSSLARLRHATPEKASFTFVSLLLVTAASAVIAVQLLPEARVQRRMFLASILAGVALLPLALLQWDSRTPWLKYVDSPEPPPPELTRLLPAGASVYWEDGLEMLWLRMRRSSYFSCDQATGVLFYRETAMAYKRRAASFWPLRSDDFTKLDNCAISDPVPRPERNRAGLQKLCRREPGLGYVVLTAPLDGMGAGGIWNAPVRFQDFPASRSVLPKSEPFYIYACGDVR